jgi:hypothetical protein
VGERIEDVAVRGPRKKPFGTKGPRCGDELNGFIEDLRIIYRPIGDQKIS